MKQKSKIDVFDMITQIRKSIFDEKPTTAEMMKEVRMMKYKIKPVQGDISELDFQNDQFIGALWSLGKLDEFCEVHYKKIGSKQQDIFYRMVDQMRGEFQQALNKVDLKSKPAASPQSLFEIEIYKEHKNKLN